MIQHDLFSIKTFAMTVPDIKRAMHEAAKSSKYSREEIVDRMNDLATRHGVALVKGNAKGITPETLEQWLKPSEIHRYPCLAALVVFCAAADTAAPIAAMASLLGVMVINEDEVNLLKWAKLYHKSKTAREQMRQIEVKL